MRKWAHMFGFGGHFSTKSRRYSTTLGKLRAARIRIARAIARGLDPDQLADLDDDQAATVVSTMALHRHRLAHHRRRRPRRHGRRRRPQRRPADTTNHPDRA